MATYASALTNSDLPNYLLTINRNRPNQPVQHSDILPVLFLLSSFYLHDCSSLFSLLLFQSCSEQCPNTHITHSFVLTYVKLMQMRPWRFKYHLSVYKSLPFLYQDETTRHQDFSYPVLDFFPCPVMPQWCEPCQEGGDRCNHWGSGQNKEKHC